MRNILFFTLLLTICMREVASTSTCAVDNYPKDYYESSGGPAACTEYPCMQCGACSGTEEFPAGWSFWAEGKDSYCTCPANKKSSGTSCVDCDSGKYKPQYMGYTEIISRTKCYDYNTDVKELTVMDDDAQKLMPFRGAFGSANDDFVLSTNPFWKSDHSTARYGNVEFYSQGTHLLNNPTTVDRNENVEVTFGWYAYLTAMQYDGKHYVAIIAAPSSQGTKTTSEIGAYIYSKGSNNDATQGSWTLQTQGGNDVIVRPPNVDIFFDYFGAYARWRHNTFGMFYWHTHSGTKKGEFNLAQAGSYTGKVADATISNIDAAYTCVDHNFNPNAGTGDWQYRVLCHKFISSSKYEIKLYQRNKGGTAYTSNSVEVDHHSETYDANEGSLVKQTRHVGMDNKNVYFIGGTEPYTGRYVLNKVYKRSISSSGTIGSTETEIYDSGTSVFELKTHPNTDGFIGLILSDSTNFYIEAVKLISSTGSLLKTLEVEKYKIHGYKNNDLFPYIDFDYDTEVFKKMHEVPAHVDVRSYIKSTHFASSGDHYGTIYDYADGTRKSFLSFGMKNMYFNVAGYNKETTRITVKLEHAFGCPENFYGDNGICTICPTGKVRAKGDDPDCTDCVCSNPPCQENFYGNNGVCTACPSGSVRAAGDLASCTNCECTCPANYFGNGNGCTACADNTAARAAGDLASCTTCKCECLANFFGNNGACTACGTGYTNDAGDNQMCTTCACDAPVQSSGTSIIDPAVTPTVELDDLTLTADSTVVGNGATITVKTGKRAFQAGNKKLVVKNITIEGGDVYPSSRRRRLLSSCDTPGASGAKDCMGGIAHTDGGTLEFEDAVLKGGNAKYGGCLYGQNGATIKLTRTIVKDCTIDNDASGTFSATTDTLVGGAGIYLRGSSSTLTMVNSDLLTNTCGDQTGTNWQKYCSGGALHLADGASGTITGGSIKSNKGHMGAAFYLIESGHLVLSGITSELNDASFAGGGVMMVKSKLTLKDGTKFLKNEGEYFGGAIYYLSDGTSNYLKIFGSVIKGNKVASPDTFSKYLGGGISSGSWTASSNLNFRTGLIEIRESTFCNNKNGATINQKDGDHIYYRDDDQQAQSNSKRRPTVIIVNSQFVGSSKSFGAMDTVPTSAACSGSPCSATGFTGSCTDLADNLGTKCECSTGTLEPSFMGSESCCTSGCAGAGHCVLCEANDKASGGVCVDCETDKYSLGGNDPTDGDSTCKASCTDAPNDATCLNVCAKNYYVNEIATNPPPQYGSLSGENGQKTFLLTFNENIAAGTLATADFKITATYQKPGGASYSNEKWTGGTVISSHDTEADATTACNNDNDCVGIHYTSVQSFTYPSGSSSMKSPGNFGCCDGSYSTCYLATSNYYPQCDGAFIETKTFSYVNAYDYSHRQMWGDGQIAQRCKTLGTCGCVIVDEDSTYDSSNKFETDSVKVHFYVGNGCSVGTTAMGNGHSCQSGGCTREYGLFEATSSNKWQAYKGAGATRTASSGSTAKTLGSPTSETGDLTISAAVVDNGKVKLTIDGIVAPASDKSLIDTTTVTVVAYTNNNNKVKDAGGAAVATFSGGPTVATEADPACASYPCYKCKACNAGFENDGGDNPALNQATACKPTGNAASCAINQKVVGYVCTDCPAGKHNPNGASLNTHTENGAANNLCCDHGLYPDTAGTSCIAKSCSENERVDANGFCVACSGGNRDAGDKTNEGETQCYPTPTTAAASNTLSGSHDIGVEEDVGQKLVDYNNDGILDIVYYRAGTSGTAGANTVVVYINEGTNANPNYQKKLTHARPASKFVEPIEDVIVKDFDNDGKADILVVKRSTVSAGTKSGGYVLLKGGDSDLTATSDAVTGGPLAPVTVFDKNADGYLDICGSGTESGVDCKVNKADGTIASFNAGATYKGKCATGKYSSVAMDKNTALLQLNVKGTCTENLYDLELAVNQQHTATLTPALTAAVNDAKWIDIDNDGDEELAVLTDNELQVYTFTRTTAYSYPQTLSQTNVDTSLSVASVISSHTTEAAAVTACDGDSDCIGVQLTASGSWEAVKGQLAYKKAASQQTTSAYVTTGNPRYYLPKSSSDLAAQDDKFHCFSQFTHGTASGVANDYYTGADLGAVSPTSLSELPAACIFDSEADVEDKDKIDTCLTTANNFYVNSCAATTNCVAIHARWNQDDKDNGHKKIGDKWVLITTNLKQGDQSPASTSAINGCHESNYGMAPFGMQYYRVVSSGVTPKFKARVATKTITAGTGTKVSAYSTCDICDTTMNEIVVADVRKTGTPQLVLSKDSSTTTAMVISLKASDIGATDDIVKLKTVAPAVTNLKLGRLTSSTFSSPVQQSGGLVLNAVPSQTDTSLSSTTVKLPVSCAANFKATDGVCVACPTGSTSSGVLSPADTPNTGCTRTDNTCLVNEYVKDNTCAQCVSPETNAAGDDASGSDTSCDCVNSHAPCEGGVQKYTGTCVGGQSITCSSTGASTCAGAFTECDANGDKTWYNNVVPSNGDFSACTHDSGYKVGCVCNGAQYADNGLCLDCPTGATASLSNYDPASGDTVCLCQGEMQSDGKICSPCPTGKTNNLKDYNPKSGASECFTQFCSANQHVENHECKACPDNSQRLAGDDPAGPDTKCHCRVNSKVIGGKCLACEEGSTNPKLCYASKEGGDTYCRCNEDYFAGADKICAACPDNAKNEAGDYAGDGPSYCNCKENYKVASGACVICPDDSLNGAGDELDGGDTFCKCADNYYSSNGVCTKCGDNSFNDAPTRENVAGKCKCNTNFKVVSNACVACELTSTLRAGSPMSGADTYCICGKDEKVVSNACVDCEEGGYSDAGSDSAGSDTECNCRSGYQKINGLCEKCPDGTFSNMNSNNECVCKVGFYVKTVGSCEICPTGSTASGYNKPNVVSTCKLEPGYYVDSSGDVHSCPEGSASSGGELINGGQTKCKTTAGHYVDTNGDVQDCPANSADPGGVFVESRTTISGCVCDKGYQAVGSAPWGCGQCPEGQTTDGTHRTNEAQRGCHCKEGYFVDPTKTQKCQLCTLGGSTAEGGDPTGAATSCDCAANYRVNANAQCEQCQPGETNAPLDKTQDGETQCDITKCAANERVENNACISCPTGMINEKDDPANSVNTICDYMGDTEDQFEFDVSGSKYLVQKKDGTNLGINPTIQLRISEGPFIFSRQPASVAGNDLVLASAVQWTTQDTDYSSYTQYLTLEAKDDTSVIVWVPSTPGTFYYLSKDTSTMVGKIEVSLPLCTIPTSGTIQLANSCILSDEIVLTGDLQIVVIARRRLRKNLKSTTLMIQAAAGKRHFKVENGKKLTVKGMTLSDGNPGDAGGSILASGGTVEVENVVFKNNKGTTGGALESEKDVGNNPPSVSIKGATFDNNEGTNGGGAINAKAGSVVVETSTFKNNKATSGNGGAVASVTDLTVKTSVFESNSAPSGSGGAVSVEGKKLTMEGTTLKSNSAQNGGALEVKEGEADLRTIEVESNTATGEGGAILVDKSDVTLASSNIKSNNGQKGGGIKTKNMGGKTMESNSNTFSDNVGSDGGGAFHMEDEVNAIIKVFESTFSGNKGASDEADDMKSTGDSNILVRVVDLLSEIVRKGLPQPDCTSIDCAHRVKSNGKAKSDGSCRCACDAINDYEKASVCTPITICSPGDVTVVNATDSSDRICGSPTIAQKQASFDAAGAALSSLVTNKLKQAGLADSDAFNLAVDMIGGVNKC